MKDDRWLYLIYLILLIITAYIINKSFNLMNDAVNSASYIATISEIYGITIALTEIFILRNTTDKIKRKFNSLEAYSDITEMTKFLSQVIEDITNNRYTFAKEKLKKITEFYHENLKVDVLSDINSVHRKNYDQLNNIIFHLHVIGIRKLRNNKIMEFVKFLTNFNETLLSMKIELKNTII